MKKVIILFMALIATCQLYAQRSLTGTVVDADNPDETIIGATVKVMGTGSGTATDLNGGFTLQLPKGKNTIQVSYVGYKTLTMDVSGKSSVTIKLQSDVSKLNEVVVVGYGVMKRSDLTGSVSSIDEKAIKEGVNTSLEQAMQGRIAGVQVMQNSGAPRWRHLGADTWYQLAQRQRAALCRRWYRHERTDQRQQQRALRY